MRRIVKAKLRESRWQSAFGAACASLRDAVSAGDWAKVKAPLESLPELKLGL